MTNDPQNLYAISFKLSNCLIHVFLQVDSKQIKQETIEANHYYHVNFLFVSQEKQQLAAETAQTSKRPKKNLITIHRSHHDHLQSLTRRMVVMLHVIHLIKPLNI